MTYSVDPHHLDFTFDESIYPTNQRGIVLECAQFGDFDSFDIIRSSESMTGTPDHLLLAPIATGLKTMYYVDNAVVEGETYYYKVRVWRGFESFVSDELVASAREITDELDEYVVSLLRFEAGIKDEKGNLWQTVGGTYVSNGYLHLLGDNGGLYCNDTTFLNFGASAFCFEFIGELDLNKTAGVFLGNNMSTWYSDSAVLGYENAAFRYAFFGPPVVLSAVGIPSKTVAHFTIARDASGVMRTFLNGNMLSSDSYPTEVNFSRLGAYLFKCGWSTMETPIGLIQGVRITKGHPRYTAPFLPPEHF